MPCTAKKPFASAARTGNALLVGVKANQPSLHDALVSLCAEQDPLDRHATVDRGRHGREEHRRVELFAVAGRLPPEWRGGGARAAPVPPPPSGRGAPAGPGRAPPRGGAHHSPGRRPPPGPRARGRDARAGGGGPRREVAYYVSQVGLTAEGFGRAVRAHWGIESRSHHVRDRILGGDASRIRRRPGVFARLRSFALNILRANGVTNVSEAVYTNALSLDRLLAYGQPMSEN